MSWIPTRCPTCHNPTRFIDTTAEGPDWAGALEWRCDACDLRVLELIPIGCPDTRPGDCLNCLTRLLPSGVCPACAVVHEELVTRVHEHCGSPPQLERIDALRDTGLYRVAINALQLRLQADARDHEALSLYGRLLLDLHRPQPAVKLFRRALELGSSSGALFSLGVALANSGRPREAIEVYRRYLAAYPNDPSRPIALSNIGGCYSALGRPAKGETYHRRAIAADPDNLFPRWNLCANLIRQGRPEAAIQVIEQTAALSWLEVGQRENLHAYRADLLLRLHRYADALAANDLSLVSDPDEPNRLVLRVQILMAMRDFGEARILLARLRKLMPDSELITDLSAAVDLRIC
jgi:tetratricopeptide (TPR) repeat protein